MATHWLSPLEETPWPFTAVRETSTDSATPIRRWPIAPQTFAHARSSTSTSSRSARSRTCSSTRRRSGCDSCASGRADSRACARAHYLVPVDAVTTVGRDLLIISPDRHRPLDVPGYDPELIPDPDYFSGVYARWGPGPYPGYTPPPPYGV